MQQTMTFIELDNYVNIKYKEKHQQNMKIVHNELIKTVQLSNSNFNTIEKKMEEDLKICYIMYHMISRDHYNEANVLVPKLYYPRYCLNKQITNYSSLLSYIVDKSINCKRLTRDMKELIRSMIENRLDIQCKLCVGNRTAIEYLEKEYLDHSNIINDKQDIINEIKTFLIYTDNEVNGQWKLLKQELIKKVESQSNLTLTKKKNEQQYNGKISMLDGMLSKLRITDKDDYDELIIFKKTLNSELEFDAVLITKIDNVLKVMQPSQYSSVEVKEIIRDKKDISKYNKEFICEQILNSDLLEFVIESYDSKNTMSIRNINYINSLGLTINGLKRALVKSCHLGSTYLISKFLDKNRNIPIIFDKELCKQIFTNNDKFDIPCLFEILQGNIKLGTFTPLTIFNILTELILNNRKDLLEYFMYYINGRELNVEYKYIVKVIDLCIDNNLHNMIETLNITDLTQLLYLFDKLLFKYIVEQNKSNIDEKRLQEYKDIMLSIFGKYPALGINYEDKLTLII